MPDDPRFAAMRREYQFLSDEELTRLIAFTQPLTIHDAEYRVTSGDAWFSMVHVDGTHTEEVVVFGSTPFHLKTGRQFPFNTLATELGWRSVFGLGRPQPTPEEA